MYSLMWLILVGTSLVNCLPPPHPDVLALRRQEAQLHPHLKSPALRNPHFIQLLQLASLLHKGEKLVFEREANKVPREEIYKILTHAGFISRKSFHPSRRNNEFPAVLLEEWPDIQDTSYFPNPDVLQYL